MRPSLIWILLPLFAGGSSLSAASLVAARQQEPDEPQEEEAESELERYLRLAREGSAVVRPQAAQRLVDLGEPALERLLQECGDSPEEMAELGAQLVEVLGAFGDSRLRAKLWQALADPDFPWRPNAARALSAAPQESEVDSFAAMLADPLALVREEAVMALGRAQARDHEAALRAHLEDPDDRVRRAAVRVMFRFGDRCTVAWLLEDLKRDDRFFELQTGKLARYEALKLLRGDLEGHLQRKFDYTAEKTWDDPDNAEGARQIREYAQALCRGELPEPPPIARAGKHSEGDVLGLEIRSCRRGEYFLRWNAADVLYVGTGNAVAIELPEGTVARLLEAAGRELGAFGRERLWGQPGCDLEQVHWRTAPGARTTSFRISKGQKRVEGLRPEAIGTLQRLMLETLPEDGEDPRVASLRARVAEALAAVGGPLPAPSND